jgi:hypothetical protein
MNKLKYTSIGFGALLMVLGISLLINRPIVHALSPFNYTNYLMDDTVFESSGTMSATAIQTFLQNEGSGLATFSDVENCGSTSGTHYSYYATYYTCGSLEPASKIIYDASQAYGINPEVILATLQKEQSLVTTPNPTASQLDYAMGYGCPDSGGCSYPGFFNQVDNGTWQFRADMEWGSGNTYWGDSPSSYPCGGPTKYYSAALLSGNNVTFYNDNGTGYANFTIPDMSTATLYCYTPHVYPGSAQEYYSGSYNFVYYFNLWFVPYIDSYYAQSNYPTLNPGQSATVWFEYQNDGYETWYDNNSIGSAPTGTYPIHLATDDPINRSSVFGATWPSATRPDENFSAVYNSNGTTLASNQDEVQPGQIVKFSFTMTAPSSITPGSYYEHFVPIAEGSTNGLLNDPGTSMVVTINSVPNISWLSQSSYPTIDPGMNSSTYVMLTNTGNVPLYDDDSIVTAPPGSYPVHLATSNPLNSTSSFSANWPSATRAAKTFSAVYNSDGVTLASNQHVAQPGQIVKFSFPFNVPAEYTSGTYTQYLQPILEGTSGGYFSNLGISWTITVPTTPVIEVTNSPTISTVSNEPSQLSLGLENVGNVSTSTSVNLTTTTGSQFATSAWVSPTTVQALGQSLAAGSSLNISLPILAPTETNNTTTDFDAGFNNNGTVLPVINALVPASITGTSYSAKFVSNTPLLTLANNQAGIAIFNYQNTGNQPWYDDNSISSSTWRDSLPTHLATANPINRSSGFDYNWPNSSRPATTFSAVYNSDGVTLASNQHIAQPGQIVSFAFSMSPENWVGIGAYKEYFQPIIEGTTDGAIHNINSYINVNVLFPIYSAAFFAQSGYPTLNPGQQATSWFEYTNTGNQTWYDDDSIGSASVGTDPIHLATNRLLNRSSAFGPTWPSYSRSNTTFSAVYNSDGVTLASNQHIAQPGQIVKFSFTMTAPTNLAPGTYPEYFIPVAEGSATGSFTDPGTNMLVTVN